DSPLDAPTTPHTAPLSLHDALPISNGQNTGPTHPYPPLPCCHHPPAPPPCQPARAAPAAICARAAGLPSTRPLRKAPPRESEFRDRKSTRLNSSHQIISYAVFCLKK